MNTYTGSDNLEIMAAAVNYNNFLMTLLSDYIQPKFRILDIGAGIGTFAKKLRDEGYNVLCFEPDEIQAELIKSNGLPVASSIKEIELSSLDFIYSLNVLEHIEDDLDALTQWLALLKPGGRMLLYVPAFQILYSSMDKKVGHFRRYNKEELIRKSKAAGFDIIRAEYADSLGFFASLMYKYFNNGSGDINHRALVFYDRIFFPISRFLDFFMNTIMGKNLYIIVERKLG
jgi:2-polyprenyl-3-methyl-5-hydroxy-6-metoxy-1,4-benzoquinol methylase